MASLSLNKKIIGYLLAIWAATAIIGAIGLYRIDAVRSVAHSTTRDIVPSASAALEVENAVQEIFANTYPYCSYGIISSRDRTHQQISLAKSALQRWS
jgi:hypothetical protein